MKTPRISLQTWLAAVGLALAGVLVTGCEDEIERAMGQQTAAAVEKEYGVNPDPVLGQWATVMGHRLVGQCPRQKIEYSFKVINTDMVNAFAAPWGFVYVTRGMMGFARSEDEVAFILGHEVGHVANRDAISSMKKNILFSLGAALIGGKNETWGDISSIGAGLLLLHYSRSDERDADDSGAMTAFGAGYDPSGGEAFFARLAKELEKQQPSRLEHLFLTHPETPDRIAALKKRPEFNLQDAAVASRIGRGYARRYAFGKAASYYNLALKTKPEAIQTRLALAEAYGYQGFNDKARTQYQTVLQHEGGNASAQTGLAALGQLGGPQLTAVSAGERQAAGTALAGDYGATTSAVGLSLGTYQGAIGAVGPDLASAAGTANKSIAALLGFAQTETELSEAAQGAFVLGNAAVSRANDTAMALEGLANDMLRVRDQLQLLNTANRQALAAVAAGQAYQGDLAMYRRSLVETRHAAELLALAAAEAPATAKLVKKAATSGTDAVTALNAMVTAKDHDRYIAGVKTTAEVTNQAAQAAQAAANKIKKMTSVAEARLLLAKLNLAALGASPEVRVAYDGLVAHYCGARPRQVETLRAQGLGYGDAAFLLSAARGLRTEVGQLTGIVGTNEVISGLQGRGASFDGPVLLLRFLANSLEDEAQARSRG